MNGAKLTSAMDDAVLRAVGQLRAAGSVERELPDVVRVVDEIRRAVLRPARGVDDRRDVVRVIVVVIDEVRFLARRQAGGEVRALAAREVDDPEILAVGPGELRRRIGSAPK